jgi:cathepsin L
MKGLILAGVFVLILGLVHDVTSSSTIHKKTPWHQLDSYTFADYVAEFDRSYASPEEYSARKLIFEANLEKIKAHNRDSSKTWKAGVNQLTDHTEEEFRKLLGYRKGLTTPSKTGLNWKSNLSDKKNGGLPALPAHVDWREQGVVSPVKDQGRCGSCWTFGSAETLESHWALSTGQLPILSEQQILDCVPNPDKCGGTGGCAGGTPELAYAYLMKYQYGLASEWTYPYLSYFGSAYPCRFNSSKTPIAAKIRNYVTLPSNQYFPVLETVGTRGPIAIAVDASSWKDYETGVYDGCNKTNPDINHSVQLVGYGTDKDGGDYWLVRNSWSPAWGELGYIRVKRSSTPTCGVDLHPQDGTGCANGPPTVVVCGECGLLYDVTFPLVN